MPTVVTVGFFIMVKNIKQYSRTALLIEIAFLLWTTLIAFADTVPSAPGSPCIIDNSECVNELTWDPSNHANYYMIYRSSDNSKYEHIGTTSSTHFTDKYADNADYSYKVTARHMFKTSDAAATDTAEPAESLTESTGTLSGEAAVSFIRSSLKERKTNISLSVYTDEDISAALFQKALAHTGEPTEGDYIKFQYRDSYADTHVSGGIEEITYHVRYYSSAREEAETDKKDKEIIESLNLSNKSDYEKIKAVYDYVRENTSYDQHQYKDNNVKRNAYSALVKGKTNCQGYSLAMYRLLTEAGIENRIVYGKYKPHIGPIAMHTWNIVKYNGKYYCLDVTNDDLSLLHTFSLHTKKEFDKTYAPDEDHEFADYPYAEKSIGNSVDITGEVMKILERF